MHRASKLIALGAVAAVLAACSGGNGTTSLPSAPQSTGSAPKATQALYPRSTMSSDGHAIVYFYNKQIELSGLVSNMPNVGSRNAQSVITGAMTYHGGPVQTAPKIYVVTWGNWSGTADPDGVATYYTNFIKGIGGSHWLSSVTQYTQSNGQAVGNAAGSFAGSWNDTTNKVPSLTSYFTYQNNIAAEAKRAAAHFGDYSTSASYVIMIPHGHGVYGFGSQYCAWHSSVSATGGTIAYTNLPYIPDAGANCGVGSVNSPGTNDGVSIVGGHEQGETETDPQPNSGWLDSGNNENGDKCAWTSLQNDSFSTGSFPTQPLWSNAANGCVR